MSYTSFDFRVFPIFVYYIALIIFTSIITLKILSNYCKRKNPASFYLALVYALLTIALITLMIGLLEAILTGYYKEIYRFSLPFAYSMVIFADIILFKFTNFFTEKGHKFFVYLVIIGLIIVFSLFLPWNYWGIPNEEEGPINIRMYTTSALVLYSYAVYIANISLCRKSKNEIDNKIGKTRLSLLIYSMISMIFFFIMIIGDTFMIIYLNHPGYSFFVYIAWIFAILFCILSYSSLFTPEWLKKRIEKKHETD